jgi:hypothetical protein
MAKLRVPGGTPERCGVWWFLDLCVTLIIWILGPVALLLLTVGLSAQGVHEVSPDGHSVTLYGGVNDAGNQYTSRFVVARVTEKGSAFNVELSTEHRYQFVAFESDGYRAGTRVAQQVIEVRSMSLGAPAKRSGWRDPLGIGRYIVVVAHFTGRSGMAFIDIRTDATRSGYLIVITSISEGKP